MTVEQFVMAYGAEQDRLRALLPEGFASLRPVLRINAEVRDGKTGDLEFNTAAEKADNRGWVNIGRWDDVPFTKDGKKTTFTLPELTISFTGVGIEGGCPAEKDNVGCYYLKDGTFTLVPAEKITANKEFCDCEFAWRFAGGAHGVSLGKTLPAIPARAALVIGSEGSGVSEEVAALCARYRLPMRGRAESLNAAVAAGVLLYILSGAMPR